MDGLSKLRFDGAQAGAAAESVFGTAQARFNVIYEFCKGDLTQDIYRELIHNENNMRPGELNGLFKVSGLTDVCTKLSDKGPILEVFGETEPCKAHGKLLLSLEDFFERRNAIAHSLNPGHSSGPGQILNDLTMLESFGKALCTTLETVVPRPGSQVRADVSVPPQWELLRNDSATRSLLSLPNALLPGPHPHPAEFLGGAGLRHPAAL